MSGAQILAENSARPKVTGQTDSEEHVGSATVNSARVGRATPVGLEHSGRVIPPGVVSRPRRSRAPDAQGRRVIAARSSSSRGGSSTLRRLPAAQHTVRLRLASPMRGLASCPDWHPVYRVSARP